MSAIRIVPRQVPARATTISVAAAETCLIISWTAGNRMVTREYAAPDEYLADARLSDNPATGEIRERRRLARHNAERVGPLNDCLREGVF